MYVETCSNSRGNLTHHRHRHSCTHVNSIVWNAHTRVLHIGLWTNYLQWFLLHLLFSQLVTSSGSWQRWRNKIWRLNPIIWSFISNDAPSAALDCHHMFIASDSDGRLSNRHIQQYSYSQTSCPQYSTYLTSN